MKPTVLIACLCCLFSIAGSAQDGYHHYLSGGLNVFYDPDIGQFEQSSFHDQVRRETFRDQLLRVSPSFGFREVNARQWFLSYSLLGVGVDLEEQVIEQTDPNLSEPIGGEELLHIWAWGRFEVGKYFARRPDPKIRFGLSGSVDPYYVFYQSTPKTSVSFPSQTQRLGIDLRLIPQLEVRLKERVYLYASVPVTTVAIQGERFQIDDPTIPTNQRNNVSFGLEAVPVEAQGNLGIRYQLNP